MVAQSDAQHRSQTQGEEHMKFILIPLVLLMVPLAFIVVVFDVAKALVEDKVEAKLKEKNT
jgi:hypothetical protein